MQFQKAFTESAGGVIYLAFLFFALPSRAYCSDRLFLISAAALCEQQFPQGPAVSGRLRRRDEPRPGGRPRRELQVDPGREGARSDEGEVGGRQRRLQGPGLCAVADAPGREAASAAAGRGRRRGGQAGEGDHC